MIFSNYEKAQDVAGSDPRSAQPWRQIHRRAPNLIDLINKNVERPNLLIDINHLPLAPVQSTAAGGLRIGALSAQFRCCLSRPDHPSLSAAGERPLLAGASAQLRNAATMGGNLLQRTRLLLFLRHRDRVQQTRAGRRL